MFLLPVAVWLSLHSFFHSLANYTFSRKLRFLIATSTPSFSFHRNSTFIANVNYMAGVLSLGPSSRAFSTQLPGPKKGFRAKTSSPYFCASDYGRGSSTKQQNTVTTTHLGIRSTRSFAAFVRPRLTARSCVWLRSNTSAAAWQHIAKCSTDVCTGHKSRLHLSAFPNCTLNVPSKT